MWSSLRACSRRLCAARSFGKTARKTFLSDSFRCDEAWNKRFSSPVLQKVKLDEMFIELDERLDEKEGALAVDIDIFANALKDEDSLDELADVLCRFRLCKNAATMLPSTHHAVVRAFLDFGDTSELLRILNDRLNYGVFPDDYTYLLLMDHFIKKEDFTSAARTASTRMLQEDFANPLLNQMSLYACHKYLLNPSEFEPPEEPEPDSGEEVKIRVGYLRNPYFDDHFDLRDPNALVGKTLHMICRERNDPIGRNYRAVGLCLHKKWDDLKDFVSSNVNQKSPFYSSAIDIMDKFIGSLPDDEQKPLDELKSAITSARDSAVPNDLLAETADQLKSLVVSEEPKIVEEQCQTFASWENNRENILKAELEELNRKRRLREVEKKKEELKKEEEEIFFFDNEDVLDLRIENKRVRYPKKWLGKKKKKREAGAEYVPPEITVQRAWKQ